MKRYFELFLFAWAVSLIAVISSPSPAVNPQDPMKTLRATGIQEIVLENARKSLVVLANPCKNAQFSPLNDFAIFTQLKYGAHGMISKGMWRQRVRWKGCGRERTLNILISADADKNLLQAVAIAPGNTRADPLLQKNIPRSAKQLVESTEPIQGCLSIYVDDTKFLQETKNPNKGIERPMWEELWTFDMCKKKVQTVVTFVPDVKGVPYTMALKKAGGVSSR